MLLLYMMLRLASSGGGHHKHTTSVSWPNTTWYYVIIITTLANLKALLPIFSFVFSVGCSFIQSEFNMGIAGAFYKRLYFLIHSGDTFYHQSFGLSKRKANFVWLSTAARGGASRARRFWLFECFFPACFLSTWNRSFRNCSPSRFLKRKLFNAMGHIQTLTAWLCDPWR
jgi:hypothetical protein